MNRAARMKAARRCAMYEMEVQLITVIPGRTPYLACLYPQEPPLAAALPVFGAVAGAVGCLGAHGNR